MRGLFRLLPTFLSPYQPQVLLVVTLLLIQSIANLYLPNLNADIINNGVVKGDIGYIWRIGGLMLALAAGVVVLAVVAVYFASRTSMSFGRDVRVIRAFNRTPDERERFEVANLDLTTTGLRVNRIFAAGLPVLLLIMNLSSVAIVWFGGHLIGSGSMPVGNLFAFLSYIMQIFWAMMLAVMMVIFVPRAAASASRLDQVLATQPSITDPAEPIEPVTTHGTIDFQAVSFGYPGGEKPVLCDLSFDVRP